MGCERKWLVRQLSEDRHVPLRLRNTNELLLVKTTHQQQQVYIPPTELLHSHVNAYLVRTKCLGRSNCLFLSSSCFLTSVCACHHTEIKGYTYLPFLSYSSACVSENAVFHLTVMVSLLYELIIILREWHRHASFHQRLKIIHTVKRLWRMSNYISYPVQKSHCYNEDLGL